MYQCKYGIMYKETNDNKMKYIPGPNKTDYTVVSGGNYIRLGKDKATGITVDAAYKFLKFNVFKN